MVEAKNYYWKALSEAKKKGKSAPHELKTNLANCLKGQYRIAESLAYYDSIIGACLDIPEAYANRADALKMLKSLSDHASQKMISEIAKNYLFAANSTNTPAIYVDMFLKQVEITEQMVPGASLIDVEDEFENQREFATFTEFRRFCCQEKLTLTVHGLYCSCYASIRDDLSIFSDDYGLFDSFTVQMEQTLNRVKSEFSLAREHYFSYINSTSSIVTEESDICYSELANGECLGAAYEKLRTSFRLCFGILDKIALAIVSGYGIDKANENIYFHSFWRLDTDDRRKVFENIKSPGLLALYSIATDLNQHKDGQWSKFKDWRNAMEHGSFVLVHEDDYLDPFDSYSLSNSIVVPLKEFEGFVQQMLYLTRSAIFSFVFAIKTTNSERNEE